MPDEFDPYHLWLSIPPDSGLRHHYRLLGLAEFEPDEDVIDSAANRLTVFMRSVATGDRQEIAERVIREIAEAREVLLSPKEREKYDDWLRKQLASASDSPAPGDEPADKQSSDDDSQSGDADGPPARPRRDWMAPVRSLAAGVGNLIAAVGKWLASCLRSAKDGLGRLFGRVWTFITNRASAFLRLLKVWKKEVLIYGGAAVLTAIIVYFLLQSGGSRPVEPANDTDTPEVKGDAPESAASAAAADGNFSTTFTESSLDSITGLMLDVPDPQIASIELDNANEELVLTTTAPTDLWVERSNAPIAYTLRPEVETGQTWFAETHMRLPGQPGHRPRIGGILPYPDRDGSGGSQDGMEWSLEVNEWDDRGVEVQAFGDSNVGDSGKTFLNPNPPVKHINEVFFRLEVTENGESDHYKTFYRQTVDAEWQLLAEFNSTVDNSRIGLFMKSGDLGEDERSVMFQYFKTGIVPDEVGESQPPESSG